MKSKRIYKGFIYQADEPYDEEYPEYDCYIPANYVDNCIVGDCWVCNKEGDVCPGYENCGVPISAEGIGEIIGRVDLNTFEIDLY